MPRIQITGDDDRLALTLFPGYRKVAQGCMLIAFTFVCITLVGILAILQGNVSTPTPAATASLELTNPRGNHFGFLWLCATTFMSVLIPAYVAMVYHQRIVFLFDKEEGVFLHNRRVVAPLHRVEAVRLRHSTDPDGRILHKLLIVHTDGFEVPVDDWYNAHEITYVARVVAGFLDIPIFGLGPDRVEEGILKDLREA
jgi:hypothetical protein